MKKFKYKMVVGNVEERIFADEEMLSEYGADGWEVISVVYPIKPIGEGFGARAALYYLKKEL